MGSVIPSLLPSVNPSSLPSGIPSSLPSVSSSPTTCVDLKQSGVKFDYTRFKSDGVTVKKEKTGKKCRHLAKESGANIEESCDNDMVNEGLTVANYCKATCDNCGDDSADPTISPTTCVDLKQSGVKFDYTRFKSD